VFNGGIDGHFAAYDGKTMNELWSFEAGTGIQAPPVTFSINGKQYIAVLAGARQNPVLINDYPELRTRHRLRCCMYSACRNSRRMGRADSAFFTRYRRNPSARPRQGDGFR